MYFRSTWARSLERRNPASQTIILSLSQCSSGTRSVASPAIVGLSHFPVRSGKSATFAHRGRLTGGLPDVGTDEVLDRNLIRDAPSGPSGAGWREDCLQGAVITVSIQCSDRLAKGMSKGSTGWGLRNTGRDAPQAATSHSPSGSAAGWAQA